MGLKSFFSLVFRKTTPKSNIDDKEGVERVQEIFQELRDIQTKVKRLQRFSERTSKKIEDLNQYESLTKEEHIKISKLIDQYTGIVEQRRLMEGRLIRNNPALRVIQENEKQMPDILKEMRHTETQQRYAQSDILYLTEEKDELYDYRETLIAAYRGLKIAAIIMVILLGIALLALFTMVQSLQRDIFVPTSMVAIIAIFSGFGILIFKRNIEFELDKNELMQQKAVKLLNKTKVKYFHYTNYLDYEYNRLGVTTSDQLQGHYNRYLKNKNNEENYKGLNAKLIDIEQRVFDLLYDKGIEKDVFDNIDDWVEVQNSHGMLKNLQLEYNNTSKQLEALKVYEEELCKEAFVIASSNKELTSIVESLMDGYMKDRNTDTISKEEQDEEFREGI